MEVRFHRFKKKLKCRKRGSSKGPAKRRLHHSFFNFIGVGVTLVVRLHLFKKRFKMEVKA